MSFPAPKPTLTEEQRELVNANVRLVSLAIGELRHNSHPHSVLVDLRSIGNAALIQAARYSPAVKGKFSTYAMRCIRGAILRATAENILNDQRFPTQKNYEEPSTMDGIAVLENAEQLTFDLAQLRRALRILPTKQRILVKSYFGVDCQRKPISVLATERQQSWRTVRKQLGLSVRQLRRTILADALSNHPDLS